MAELPKIPANAALTKLFALMHKAGAQSLAKHPVMGKIRGLKEHPVAQKILAKEDILWAILGVVLIFHGTHFKKLFLCFQLVRAFCFERLKASVCGLCGDVSAAHEKVGADAGDSQQPAPAEEESNKHAKKRDTKKAAGAASKDTSKEDAAMAKKMLKSLDTDKFASACVVVLASLVACVLVMQGGLVQSLVVSHALVAILAEKAAALVDFSEHADVEPWVSLSIRAVLYAVCVGGAFLAAPAALAMLVAACGAQLLMAHIPQLEKLGGNAALAVPVGVTAFGTLWQVWTWAAGGGMAWYFQVLYFPAVIAEGILGLF